MRNTTAIIRLFFKHAQEDKSGKSVHENENFCGWDDAQGICLPSKLFFFHYLPFSNENMKGEAICHLKGPACLTPSYLAGAAHERGPGTPDISTQAACGEAPELRYHCFPAVTTPKLKPSAHDVAV